MSLSSLCASSGRSFGTTSELAVNVGASPIGTSGVTTSDTLRTSPMLNVGDEDSDARSAGGSIRDPPLDVSSSPGMRGGGGMAAAARTLMWFSPVGVRMGVRDSGASESARDFVFAVGYGVVIACADVDALVPDTVRDSLAEVVAEGDDEVVAGDEDPVADRGDDIADDVAVDVADAGGAVASTLRTAEGKGTDGVRTGTGFCGPVTGRGGAD